MTDKAEDWWEEWFCNRPTVSEMRGHACGAHEMLVIIAYDISSERRLARVARYCEDYAVRVQYSVFECKLPIVEFDRFWEGLKKLIDPKEDRLVAYRICAECAKDVRSFGTMTTMAGHEPPAAYVL
jgi:CRISPR-associated protein Cas2